MSRHFRARIPPIFFPAFFTSKIGRAMAPRKRTAARRASEKAKELLKQNKGLQLDDSEEWSSGLQSDSDVSDVVISSEQSSDESSKTSEEGIPLKAKRSKKEALVKPSDESEGEVGDKKQPTLLTTNRKRLMKKKKRAGIKCSRKRGSSSRKVQTERFEWQQWEDELQDWGPWSVDRDDSFDNNLPFEKGALDAKEPPSELLMPLLPFQKEWLSWSMKQEASDIRGGILADEMGMGKTIQAISLILTNKSSPLSCVSPHAHKLHQVPPQVKATLVVCPLVAVIQWRNEIARYTKEGSVKVLLYHGGKRCKDVLELAEYDIVLTTYSIVELEHRLGILPPKEHCKWCGKLFYPDRMNIHLRFFCGPDAKKTEKQAKQVKKKPGVSKSMPLYSKGEDGKSFSKGRYIKGKGKQKFVERPSLTLEFLERGFENECSTVITRGQKRKVSEEELAGALTVVIESSEKASELHLKGSSILHAVRWNRIILDEAHYIKDRRCSTAKAVFALQSNFKWALSGTPLQNRVGELYSLVRFLDIKPYSYYYCKKCNCKSLDYSFGKEWRKCDLCKHSPLHHFCWWNKFIANPIKKWGYVHDGRKAMLLLKHKLLDGILLRRTKLERAADLALPPSTKFLRRDAFDAREEDFYQALYTQSQSQFNTYVNSGTLLNNYAHIFDLLTRLRQAVDHPYLVVYSRTGFSVTGIHDTSDANLEVQCGICNDTLEDAVVTGCKHAFCKVCIQDYISAAGSEQAPPCPTCQHALTVDLTGSKPSHKEQKSCDKGRGHRSSSILNRIKLEDFQSSTKIDALREEITLMLKKDCGAKAIVFSQFTSFLDLIGFRLEKFGIKCVKLDGSMSITARDQMIESFTNDPDYKVFLMSLKAGGVALNLTVASHVFLMDPWWNPAVEQQAQDRIHRLGQYKPIRVVRFVIENTIEERILKLQEKKQLVFEGTVGGSQEALGRLTEQDLRFLFAS